MFQGDSYASTSRLSICPQVTKRNSFRYSVRMSLTCSNLTPDNQYNDAIKSYAMIKFLKAGGSVALLWGGLSNVVSDSGLRTPTTAGGDQPLPWYFSYKAFTKARGIEAHYEPRYPWPFSSRQSCLLAQSAEGLVSALQLRCTRRPEYCQSQADQASYTYRHCSALCLHKVLGLGVPTEGL